jgi:hypothetical protein
MAKFNTITKEEALKVNAHYKSENFDLETELEKFRENYTFNEKPSRSAMMCSCNTKQHLMLLWNQYIACEEATSEQVYGLPVTKTLGTMTVLEQLDMFQAFLEGIMESYKSELNK